MPSRRRFLADSALAGAASVVGWPARVAAESPPETTTVRLATNPSICVAPEYVAEDLLRAEGFTDVRYVGEGSGVMQLAAVGRGEIDFSLNFAVPNVLGIDGGEAITVLAGIHTGCIELFANEHVHSVADLRGKSIGVQALGASGHLLFTVMYAHVGLDPKRDINWVSTASPSPLELFADGKLDAFLGHPPEPQELRARKVGRVIVNSAVDRPWSQYFCCLLTGNRDFVRKHPNATKRVTRAILKAADLCVSDPQRAARRMVDRGFTPRYDYAFQTLSEVPYGRWRDYDPEDTMRFYALRLHEAGMIKSNPKKIIAEGTDWRFLNELKRELKA